MLSALASWLDASIAPQKTMHSSENLCLKKESVRMLQRKTGLSV